MNLPPAPSVAFVTVSYAPDRDRCALLSRSLEAFAPSFEHWIVVDNADRQSFRALENERTTVLTTEEVLPLWLRRLNLRKLELRSNLWLQARGKPVRGWLLQQMVKLATAEVVTADVVVHADSDVVLLRSFQPESLVDREGRVRLYSRPAAIGEDLLGHVEWHRTAEKLLSIGRAELPVPDFITSLVPWKRENASALLAHIEANTGHTWFRAVAAAWDVSEYILYGRFVTDVLGDAAGQFTTSASLCRDYWTPAPLSAEELDRFLEDIAPEQVAVSITAKAGMEPLDYVGALERHWAALDERNAPAFGHEGRS